MTVIDYDFTLSQPEIHDKQVKDYFEAGKSLKSLELIAYVPLRLIDISGTVSSILHHNPRILLHATHSAVIKFRLEGNCVCVYRYYIIIQF